MSCTSSERFIRSRMLESLKNLYLFTAPGYPPIMPVEVGIALPEESVSCVIASVPCGMKQDSADSPPRYLPAPPESHISFLYKNNTGKLCSVCSTFGSLQIGVRAWPPVEMPSACENAPIAPPIGSTSR